MVQEQKYKPYDFIKLLRKTKDGASWTDVTVELYQALDTAYQTPIYQLSLVKSGWKKGGGEFICKLGQEEINV